MMSDTKPTVLLALSQIRRRARQVRRLDARLAPFRDKHVVCARSAARPGNVLLRSCGGQARCTSAILI
jgi:hypothetical protein